MTHLSKLLVGALLLTLACSQPKKKEVPADNQLSPMEEKLADYKSVQLITDLSQLSESEKVMIPKLIEAAKIMDKLFWYEAYGKKDSLLAATADEATKQYIQINYGPWDRLANNEPFVDGVGAKPAGANFYPADMTKEEFEAAELEGKSSLYTFIRRNDEGNLIAIPYHEMFEEEVQTVSNLLRECAELAEDTGLKKYLSLLHH